MALFKVFKLESVLLLKSAFKKNKPEISWETPEADF